MVSVANFFSHKLSTYRIVLLYVEWVFFKSQWLCHHDLTVYIITVVSTPMAWFRVFLHRSAPFMFVI